MAKQFRSSSVTLYDLETHFNLQRASEGPEEFFFEWQSDLPELNDMEQQLLDDVKAGYLNLLKYPAVLENVVHMVVLSPLLQLTGFYRDPFWLQSEKASHITTEDEDISVEGKIDVLIMKNQLWVMVIESKRLALSIENGLAQILSYMLANPERDGPTFGLITNGSSFIFLKLAQAETPVYGLSRRFELLNPGNELYGVLQVLKRFKELFL